MRERGTVAALGQVIWRSVGPFAAMFPRSCNLRLEIQGIALDIVKRNRLLVFLHRAKCIKKEEERRLTHRLCSKSQKST